MKFDNYEVIEHRWISDLNSDGYILKHKKTGACVTLLLNDDDNKVFYIGFKTPPKDSTGVAHILEHSVLCGSKKFPIKDPFVELAKGSLNTFLNAMTYPDKTVYPVASCNDKDFHNLIDVYLDAVFNPNIYREEKIFRQEGWHYELENEEDELKYNGVVYNEMKGVFSSPDDVVEREIMNCLYPGSTYGIESGGDPDDIPELTYEQFLDFHSKYYHPSNSFIYLYGNLDAEKYLDFIDREYLSNYSYLEVDSDIVCTPSFDGIRVINKEYSVLDDDSDEGAYLTYALSAGTSLDKELYIALDVLDYVLCSAPGALIKKALYDNGIGNDVYSSVETGILQPYFALTAKGTSEDRLDDFRRIVEEELKKASEGLPKKSLRAALNIFEFRYREADFGSYPRGLMLGLQSLDSWLYDKKAPFMHIEENETFAKLRKGIEEGYFEELIKKYFIDNGHKILLCVVPKKGLTKIKEDELKEKLSKKKAALSKEELKEIVNGTKALKEYQETPDSPEDLKKLPMLKREDLKKEPFLPINEKKTAKDIPVLFHDIFTSGISYAGLFFNIKYLPEELYPYVGILTGVLGLMDTKEHKYDDLYNEVNIHTGGIRPSFANYPDYSNGDVKSYFIIRAKYLKDERSEAFKLIKEIIVDTDFTDTKRLLEILNETKMRLQSTMVSSGHLVASMRATSYFSRDAWIFDKINGGSFYRFLCDIIDGFEDGKEELIEKLGTVCRYIFRRDNLLADFTGTQDDYEGFEDEIINLSEQLNKDGTKDEVKTGYVPEKKNEGFKTAGSVQYVALAGNYKDKGLEYTGALRVLRVLMAYDYLWNKVRVLGGAYGCMGAFKKTGDCFFVSYRDPNLRDTITVYRKAAEYIKNIELDERSMLQYIIGALSELDIPLTPSMKGSYSLGAYLSDISDEDFLKERQQLLNTDADTIRGLAEYIEAFVSEDNICVVGNAEAIEENSDLFLNMEQLI
ncbi:MAG: insulinase family protein [Lachnospiraceae bacterium]|nr:insulinase family protein [Lachnospiraceae bacterium]